ncbi:MAG: hypothetical protein KatS3mg131_3020 [Candidatus Tectimicrobiota bacterium]|nr:MAG: hypothetical protein KatS3mg131_3020 [Candidatus Tectomicrobia bacterium]
MRQSWVALALLSAVAWAFWGMFGKLSTNHAMPPLALAFFSSLASAAVITLAYAWQRFPLPASPAALAFALLSGVCGAIGVLLFAVAIREGSAAIVVALTATYPAITLVLGPLVLQENVTPQHALGIVLVTLGVMLVAR